jgi:bacterioferritin-associated ferredoxin
MIETSDHEVPESLAAFATSMETLKSKIGIK